MSKPQYKETINTSAEKVYNTMLGLKNIKTYEAWTAVFNPTSTYEGSWNKGEKILFLGTDKDGNRAGMVSEIAENIQNKFVSIRHVGILDKGVEITSGEGVANLANCFENYHFEEENGKTTLMVEITGFEEHQEYFNSTYPKALAKLKEITESE